MFSSYFHPIKIVFFFVFFLFYAVFAQNNSRIIRDLESLERYIETIPRREDRDAAFDLIDNMYSLLEKQNHSNRPNRPNRPSGHGHTQNVLSESGFNKLLTQLKEESFDDNKIKIVQATVNNGKIDSQQLKQIVQTFTFDKGKVAVIKWIYSKLIDPININEAIEEIMSSLEKKEVNRFIRDQQNN